MANIASGYNGWVAFGIPATGTPTTYKEMDLSEWSVDDNCEVQITKSFKLRGHQGANPGFIETILSLKGYFNSLTGENPYVDYGLKEGFAVKSLILGIQGRHVTDPLPNPPAGLLFFFPELLCRFCKTSGPVDGVVGIEAELTVEVDFKWPGDAIP